MFCDIILKMSESLRQRHCSRVGTDGPVKPIGSSVNDIGRGLCLGDGPSESLTFICRGERPAFSTRELDMAGLWFVGLLMGLT